MKIEIKELSKIYGGNTVLNIPELTIESGQLIGLVGNNGAGKTTLLSLMLDLIYANTGYIRINGRRVTENMRWKEFTGSYIDHRFLVDIYTPEEFFIYIGDIYGFSKETVMHRLERYHSFMRDEILGQKKYLKDFSEGNRQKIGILAAMIIEPKVLLLDEPFNYLDPSSQNIVAGMLTDINHRLGTTIIVSSHNLNYITDISTRILLMEKGVIVKDIPNHSGDALDILKDYFNENDIDSPQYHR